MVSVELVVPVGGEHERIGPVDPAAEHAQDVERRLVRPMHVLEHEQRRSRERREELGGYLSWRLATMPTSRNGPSGVAVVRFSHQP